MRILFLTHRLPYAPDRGDRIRAFHLLKALTKIADVDLVSLVHTREEATKTTELSRLCASVSVAPVLGATRYGAAAAAIATGRPFTHALLDSWQIRSQLERLARRTAPDLVFAYCSGMAQFTVEGPLQDIPVVMDLVDVDSAKWGALGAIDRSLKGWIYRREARCLSKFEALAAKTARATLVVNDRELETMRRLAPDANVQVVPNGIDAQFFAPHAPPSSRCSVVFCGVMNYQPNAAGALWLMERVWPMVRSKVDASLTIVGSDPTADVLRMAASDPSVTVTGRVEDVRPYLWTASVSVAPLFTARGVQNKVLEATAAGLPSVVTRAVFDGLPEEVRGACALADDADTFAAAILDLLAAAPERRRAVANTANLEAIGWDRALAPLARIISAARRD